MNPKIKLVIEKDYSMAEIKNLIHSGARFVIYQYCISLFFAVTLRRFSSAFLILPGYPAVQYKRKYNLLSIVFGWWGIPWGPVNTIQSMKINHGGGIDYTDEIMLNLTEECLAAREVDMLLTGQLFCKPCKMDTRAFKKALLRDGERDFNLKKLVVAVYINTGEGEEPHFTIGIKTTKEFKIYPEIMYKTLLKQFYMDTPFEFIDLNQDDEVCRLLEKQGETLLERNF